MELIYDVFVVWMMGAVALGMGASSLAITSFMVALYDGQVDSGERRMLKVIYWSLRWSMLMIPFTLLVVTQLNPGVLVGVQFIWFIIGILFLNATLMTVHKMPRQIGPSLQAASWYTLGFLLTIELFALAPLTWTLFLSLYAADIVFFTAVVNGYLYWRNRRTV